MGNPKGESDTSAHPVLVLGLDRRRPETQLQRAAADSRSNFPDGVRQPGKEEDSDVHSNGTHA